MNNIEIETLVENYLNDNYKDDFEIVNIFIDKEPGRTSDQINVELKSKLYPQKNFFLIITKDEKWKVTSDYYPSILMEAAAYQKVDFTDFEDFLYSIYFEFTDLLKNISQIPKNIDDAILQLDQNPNLKWDVYMTIAVEKPSEEKYAIEDMLVNFTRIIDQQIKPNMLLRLGIYQTDQIVPIDMNIDPINRLKQNDNLVEHWQLVCSTKKINKISNAYRYIVNRRKVTR